MIVEWFNNITKKLFKNDKNFRSRYVIDNIDRVTIKDILEVDIPLLNQYRSYNRLKLDRLLTQVSELRRLLDENTYNPVSINYTVVIDDVRKIKLIDLIDNGDGSIPNNFRYMIRDYIIEVEACRDLLKDMDIKNDIDVRFNWNVLNTYIITMEDIVNSLYTRLAI